MKEYIVFYILGVFVCNLAFADSNMETLFYENSIYQKKYWVDINPDPQESIKELLKIIKRSKSGKRIIYLAQKKANLSGKTLVDLVVPGDGSICDTTLIRKFSRTNPLKVAYETKSIIYLNEKLSVINAILDLAHELTHFALRTPFNPYKQNFSLAGFIKSIVEGKGGEVDAYMSECRVLYEMFPKSSQFKSNCIKMIDRKTGRFSKSIGIRKFYQIGNDYLSFKENLSEYGLDIKSFPYITDEYANFISSAYGHPYPVAAFKEYVSIMDKVCKNDWNRLAVMKQSLKRAPASQTSSISSNYKFMLRSYINRCKRFYYPVN